MSNRRRLKLKPREPDEVEAAFRDELRKGCPHCQSRRVVGRFHDGRWDFGMRCDPGAVGRGAGRIAPAQGAAPFRFRFPWAKH